jgi:hypothetical protein
MRVQVAETKLRIERQTASERVGEAQNPKSCMRLIEISRFFFASRKTRLAFCWARFDLRALK